MATYWNFREILDLYPESSESSHFTCVGMTKKGARCRNSFISRNALSRAGELLDSMDRQKKLRSSFKHLEELAILTLCPRWHNGDHPANSQVSQTEDRWRSLIAQHERKLARKTLAAMKRVEKVLRDEIDEDKKPSKSKVTPSESILKDCAVNLPLAKFGQNQSMPDPFTTKTKATSFGQNFHKGSLGSHSKSNGSQEDLTTSSGPISVSLKTKAKPERETKASVVPSHTGLPTPPVTPEDSVVGTQQNEDGNDSYLATPTKSTKGKNIKRCSSTLSTLAISQKTTDPSLASSAGENREAKSSLLRPSQTTQFSTTYFGTTLPNFGSLVVRESVVSDTHSLISKSSREPSLVKSSSQFNFGSEYKIPSKSFDSVSSGNELTKPLPEELSTMWQGLASRGSSSENHGQSTVVDVKPPGIELSLPMDEAAEEHVTPVKTCAINSQEQKQEPPTKANLPDESFGYAVVTPQPSRYATYLPTAQRHGEATPPATPDNLHQLNFNPDPFRSDITRRVTVDPVDTRKPLSRPDTCRPVVARKPLSRPENRLVETLAPICANCENAPQVYCNCGKIGDGVESVKIGCLNSFRLRRLKEKLATKFKTMKSRRRSSGEESKEKGL